jgi:deoxyribodipyrimidine photo-lyase
MSTKKSSKTKTKTKSELISKSEKSNKTENIIHDLGIFIHRKDIRIEDNRGLNLLSTKCKNIVSVFIFDPYQVELNSTNKNYLSFPTLRFLCESLKDLKTILNKKSSDLYVFYGKPKNVLKYLIKNLSNKFPSICVGFNNDFTQYSLTRDKIIVDYCESEGIQVFPNDDDLTMCSMDLLKKDETSPYKQYGAFRKNMLDMENKFNKPETKKIKFISKIKIPKSLDSDDIDGFWEGHLNPEYDPLEIGSRKLALEILSSLKDFKEYNTKRDILSYNTTHLSAYLNFGLVSEREFYFALQDKLGNSTQLINQVIWRDYYYCLLRYLEGANSYDSHVDSRYDKIKWVDTIPDKSSRQWKEWDTMMKSGTGFLLVDAAVQELLHTGFMHNRCRMIVGVFSVKYLLINPLCRYIGLNDWFSRHLLDCCTSQNKLNAQWVTELDFPGKKFAPSEAPIAGRPMNISNSMIKKWDPECIYIKKWLPHLKDVDNRIIYNWDTKFDAKIHPGPIFDAKGRYQEWISKCKIK